MSKPILPRELCRFRIADEEFVIVEKRIPDEDVAVFVGCQHLDPTVGLHLPENEKEIQWFAIRPLPPLEPNSVGEMPKDERKDDIIAYSWIAGGSFGTIVAEDYRGQGLGTVMAQQLRDIMIRHKVMEVMYSGRRNAVLEREGFDFEGTVGRMRIA